MFPAYEDVTCPVGIQIFQDISSDLTSLFSFSTGIGDQRKTPCQRFHSLQRSASFPVRSRSLCNNAFDVELSSWLEDMDQSFGTCNTNCVQSV